MVADIAVDPWQVLKWIIEDNMAISGWTASINTSWFEVKRSNQRQITLESGLAEVSLEEVGKATSPTKYSHAYIVGIHAPTRAQRNEMVREITRIFSNTVYAHKPEYDIDDDGALEETGIIDIIIEDMMETDKDAKKACLAWRCDITLRLTYGEDAP